MPEVFHFHLQTGIDTNIEATLCWQCCPALSSTVGFSIFRTDFKRITKHSNSELHKFFFFSFAFFVFLLEIGGTRASHMLVKCPTNSQQLAFLSGVVWSKAVHFPHPHTSPLPRTDRKGKNIVFSSLLHLFLPCMGFSRGFLKLMFLPRR